MKIGTTELIVIFIVALLVIGPDKLPYYAKKLGSALKEFKKVSSDMTKDVRESVIEPLEEAQKPLREAMEPLEDISKSIKKDLNDVDKDIKNIGKPPKKAEAKKEEPLAEMPTEEPLSDVQDAPEASDAAEPEAVEKQTETIEDKSKEPVNI